MPSSAQAPAGSGARAQDEEGATIKAKSDGPTKTVESTLKQQEGRIKSLEANGIVAEINGGWKHCAEHAPRKNPNKPLEGSSLVPDKPSESSVDPKPTGLIKALEKSGIQAAEGGGWEVQDAHPDKCSKNPGESNAETLEGSSIAPEGTGGCE